jgi:hypothetical protein
MQHRAAKILQYFFLAKIAIGRRAFKHAFCCSAISTGQQEHLNMEKFQHDPSVKQLCPHNF